MSLIDQIDDYDLDQFEENSSGVIDTFESPRTQNNLIGHLEQRQLIQDLYDKGHMPHAWLLKGPSGVGKETFAYHFAKFLFSQNEKSNSSHHIEETSMFGGLDLGEAPAATEKGSTSTSSLPMSYDLNHASIDRVHSGGHGDLLYLDIDEKSVKQEIKVDQVREAVRFLQKTSSEGGWRIVIINNADVMNSSAQNALLKVLEEPPKNTVLMLVSSAVSKMLPTIRSRCRLLPFEKLSDDNMRSLISTSSILKETELSIDEALAFAEGRFGYLQSFIEDQGAELFSYIIDGVKGFPNADKKTIFDIGQKINADRNNNRITRFLELFNWWCENLIKHLTGIKQYSKLRDDEITILNALEDDYEVEKSIEALMNICEKITQMKNDNLWASLDKQTLVLNAFIAFNNEFKKIKK